jgi:hypothetical protein
MLCFFLATVNLPYHPLTLQAELTSFHLIKHVLPIGGGSSNFTKTAEWLRNKWQV